jgi:hypothetical protein
MTRKYFYGVLYASFAFKHNEKGLQMSNRSKETIKRWATAFLVAAGLVSGAANATFITEADGVVLDTVTGLEWDPIANRHPLDTWSQAVADASALTIDGGGFHLALIGELEGLYNDLDAAGVCTSGNCTGNIGGFTGIQRQVWSGTESSPGTGEFFDFDGSGFGGGGEGGHNAVWAVRPNDVDVAAVPEPASLLLFGLGALGLGWARRRKS